jgi:uncharacterized protein (TIGR03083 family)
MGMSIDHQTADSLLAAYVLDAVDVDEALAVEQHLAVCEICEANAAALRAAAEPLGLAVETSPPPHLRDRVLAAALSRRPAEHHPFAPAEVHLIESTRLLGLLQRLEVEQWARPVGPYFPGWTVQDLAAHLASSEALLAIELGVDPPTPETEDQPEPRAHAAVARHRGLRPADTLAELTEVYQLVQHAVAALGPATATRIVQWFGLDLSLGHALTQRAFEIWIHADDIRATVGLDPVAPPARSLETMSHAAVETIPIMLSAHGVEGEGHRAHIVLTGAGGGTYDIALGFSDPAVGSEPDVEVEIDVVDFCRAVGDRLTAAEIDYRAGGDVDLAVGIVRALPALAVL